MPETAVPRRQLALGAGAAVGEARDASEGRRRGGVRWSGGRWGVVVGGCTVAAVLALAIPATLSYDAWAWLVWGREIVRFDLDTTGGPSWKPLPVLVAVPVSTLGDLAPAAWLVVARVGGLLALVGVYRLASRLAGRTAGARSPPRCSCWPRTPNPGTCASCSKATAPRSPPRWRSGPSSGTWPAGTRPPRCC